MSGRTKIEWSESTWNPIRARLKARLVREDARDILPGTWGYHCERISPGCQNCLKPDSLILYADLQWRPIGGARVGDEILAFDEQSTRRADNSRLWGARRWRTAIIENVWWLRNWSYRVRTDREEILASDNHRWLSPWNRWQRTDELLARPDMGTSKIRSMPVTREFPVTEKYRLGYLAGMTQGDGTFRYQPGQRSDKMGFPQAYWRVALADEEPLGRLVAYLAAFGIESHVRPFAAATEKRQAMQKVEVRALGSLEVLHSLLRTNAPTEDTDFARGWLAGFFDAEGSNGESLRLSQVPLGPLQMAMRLAAKLGFTMDFEGRPEGLASTVRLKGEMTERIRFLSIIHPAIKRKLLDGICGVTAQTGASRVVSVEKEGIVDLVDIQTSAGTFIADGLLTHNCYAERMNGRTLPAWGTGLDYTVPNRDKVEIYLDEEELMKPLHWKRARMIFPCSMTDWCADFVTDEMRDRMLAVCVLTPQHAYQFLTKRARRLEEYMRRVVAMVHGDGFIDSRIAEATRFMSRLAGHCLPGNAPLEWWDNTEGWEKDRSLHRTSGCPPRNVWLGVSVEDQQRADERIPQLLATPAAIRWVSYEPALGPVDWRPFIGGSDTDDSDLGPSDAHCLRCGCLWEEDGGTHTCPAGFGPKLDWIVVGGESGPGARPMDLAWVRAVRDQCAAAGVPLFVKQLGSRPYSPADRITHRGCSLPMPNGFNRYLNNGKGGDIAEFPADLRVREMPRAAGARA